MVEGARLEIVWAVPRLGGSNPLASAILFDKNVSSDASQVANASAIFASQKLKKHDSFVADLPI